MFKIKLIGLLSLGILTGSLSAQGIGGTVLPTNSDRFQSKIEKEQASKEKNATAQPINPNRFRSEFDVGFIYPQFSTFKFADVRNVFPVIGGEVIREVFNERHYEPSYYVGARQAFKLRDSFLGGVPELNLNFGLYNTHHHSSFSDNEITPEIYVPYIDANIRPNLRGGAVVGLFADSDLQLKRKLSSYDLDAVLRLSYKCKNWFFMPGIFFTYKRLQQKDSLLTTGSFDPTQMTLSAKVNSNHFDIGGNLRFTSPLTAIISWLGCVALAGEYTDAHYSGRQTFTGSTFDEPDELLATVRDHRHKWGISVGAETGFGFFCSHRICFSILGNIRYNNVMPYVKYPVPVVNTLTVTGPAHLKFQKQMTYGGEFNLSIVY